MSWHRDCCSGELTAISNAVPHQAFRYGVNAYGIQLHLEVTEEMIREWMKAYEEEFNGFQSPLVPKLKILSETKKKIGAYKKGGMVFFKNFFTRIVDRTCPPAPFPTEGGAGRDFRLQT